MFRNFNIILKGTEFFANIQLTLHLFSTCNNVKFDFFIFKNFTHKQTKGPSAKPCFKIAANIQSLITQLIRLNQVD